MGGSSRFSRDEPHIQFHEIEFKGKTQKWAVHSTHYPRPLLGTIKWHGAWRKYVIMYEEGTIMDKGCHKEVDNFIDEQMRLRREAKKAEKKKEV